MKCDKLIDISVLAQSRKNGAKLKFGGYLFSRGHVAAFGHETHSLSARGWQVGDNRRYVIWRTAGGRLASYRPLSGHLLAGFGLKSARVRPESARKGRIKSERSV